MVRNEFPYTASWKRPWIAGIIMSLVLVAVMSLLQPLGIYEYQGIEKFWYIPGFALCILLPMFLAHPVENLVYDLQKERWYRYNEIVTLLLWWLMVGALSYLYNEFTLNYRPSSSLSVSGFFNFFAAIIVPYSVFLLPLWVYVRYRLGLSLPKAEDGTHREVTVRGQNQNETVNFREADFVYAESQENYVDIHYRGEGGLENRLIRNTLKETASQIPNAVRVHRSYLVNEHYLSTLSGNVRKPYIEIEKFNLEIPVSSDLYKSLKAS